MENNIIFIVKGYKLQCSKLKSIKHIAYIDAKLFKKMVERYFKNTIIAY